MRNTNKAYALKMVLQHLHSLHCLPPHMYTQCVLCAGKRVWAFTYMIVCENVVCYIILRIGPNIYTTD